MSGLRDSHSIFPSPLQVGTVIGRLSLGGANVRAQVMLMFSPC